MPGAGTDAGESTGAAPQPILTPHSYPLQKFPLTPTPCTP